MKGRQFQPSGWASYQRATGRLVPITRTEEGRGRLAPRGGWTSLIEPRPVQGCANADAALDVAIRPPFAERAKAVRARSISTASRTLIGLTSALSDGAARDCRQRSCHRRWHTEAVRCSGWSSRTWRGYNYLSAFTPAHEPLNVIEVERGED